MTVNEFNKQYKISAEMQSKFNLIPDAKKQLGSSIAGKPKKMVIEIFKRFFSNPIVTISFVIFIAILLASIIIPLTSPYEAKVGVSKTRFSEYLPPLYSSSKTIPADYRNEIWKFYQTLKNSEFAKYYGFFLNTVSRDSTSSPDFNLTYNPYALHTVAALHERLTLLKSSGKVINDAVVAEELAKIPRLNTLLGTSETGYDIWTTTWYASWKAIRVALLVAIVQTVIGVSIGAFLGFHAGKMVDTIGMRIIDIIQSLPELIWLLLFVIILGANETTLIIALILVGWSTPVSTTRLFIITVKDEEYIVAAKSVGSSTARQVFVHALPAILGKIATNFVRRIPAIILSISALAFLGFFKEKDDVNLGQMLIDALPQVSNNFWILLLPSLILLTLSLSLQFVALGVHDALDPKVITKGRKR